MLTGYDGHRLRGYTDCILREIYPERTAVFLNNRYPYENDKTQLRSYLVKRPFTAFVIELAEERRQTDY